MKRSTWWHGALVAGALFLPLIFTSSARAEGGEGDPELICSMSVDCKCVHPALHGCVCKP